MPLAVDHRGQAKVCPWCLKEGDKVIVQETDTTSDEMQLLRRALKGKSDI